MREWHDLHSQLLASAAELKMRPNRQLADADAIHRSILAGLLSHIAQRHPEKGYIGARGLQLAIFPGSALAKRPPGWSRWRRFFSGGSTASRTGRAYEQLTLYGLTLVARRRIHYGPIDPALSRELFIRHALVRMEYQTHVPFFKHNRALLQKVEKMEHKSRRRDLLADEQALYDFFDARLPADICNGRRFEQWRKQAEAEQPQLLFLSESLLNGQGAGIDADALPDRLRIGRLNLKLSYHFDPGHRADGVTLHVPVAAIGQLQPERFECLVPGMLVEKLTRLIKLLPGGLRKQFVPAWSLPAPAPAPRACPLRKAHCCAHCRSS